MNTRLLNSPPIWEALLEYMPMTAMIRSLDKMSAIGMLTPGSDHERTITTRLGDIAALKKARIHSFNILEALRTYRRGKGDRGRLTWSPNEAIVKALDDAFYLTFTLIEPTNKRYLVAVDVSSPMFRGSVIGCSSITPGTAAAALALVTARTERHCEIVVFSHDMIPIAVGAHMSLPDVEAAMRDTPVGELVDCSMPMQYARNSNKQIDVFVVVTGSETASQNISPAEALRQYWRQTGISDAKLVVCAMTGSCFTIAYPDDPNILDMVGFESNGPEVIRRFVAGEMNAETQANNETETATDTEFVIVTADGTQADDRDAASAVEATNEPQAISQGDRDWE